MFGIVALIVRMQQSRSMQVTASGVHDLVSVRGAHDTLTEALCWQRSGTPCLTGQLRQS
jgi:hypothetical protein